MEYSIDIEKLRYITLLPLLPSHIILRYTIEKSLTGILLFHNLYFSYLKFIGKSIDSDTRDIVVV